MTKLSRRKLIVGAAPLVSAGPLVRAALAEPEHQASHLHGHSTTGHASMIGEAVPAPERSDAIDALLHPPPALPHRPGRVREYELVARDVELEVAQGVTYAFPARPWGMHLYHCHATPLKKHIHKGLYGAFIIDPPKPRKPAQELVMVMNAFDTDGDGENNFYAVNGPAFYFARHPIRVSRSQTVRVYLANLTEFDLINSFHLHGDFFRYYHTGRDELVEYTDTIVLAQGERGILEIDFANTGTFMFHGHQSEFAELGWMGFFEVTE